MYTDRTLTCEDCGADFVFTAGEQEFYASKGFSSDPRRCQACRRKRKADRENGVTPSREMYEIVCDSCGNTDRVPFKPRGDRPVLCSACFKKQNSRA